MTDPIEISDVRLCAEHGLTDAGRWLELRYGRCTSDCRTIPLFARVADLHRIGCDHMVKAVR